ncbi:hypothetical protein Hanom_Chr13g01185791 [Helianthus anomalus]
MNLFTTRRFLPNIYKPRINLSCSIALQHSSLDEQGTETKPLFVSQPTLQNSPFLPISHQTLHLSHGFSPNSVHSHQFHLILL